MENGRNTYSPPWDEIGFNRYMNKNELTKTLY